MILNLRSEKPPEGGRGVLIAVLTVLGICAVALVVGLVVTGAIGAALERTDIDFKNWWLLIFTGIALIPLLLFAVRLFPWLTNWYYLLPSIVFLLAFTIYPIALTIGYAFTNFSALNSGAPDSSKEATITVVDRTHLRLAPGSTIASFRCQTATCVGERIGLPDERGKVVRMRMSTIAGISGDVITLRSPIIADFQPTVARLVNPVKFVGLQNFANIFAQASFQLWPVMVWTVIFAASTTVLNTIAGLFLGILLNNKRLKFRNFYRAILFLPWAIPGVISIQMWRTLFNTNFGGVNRLIGLFGMSPVPWLDDGLWTKVAILLVNLWLGFPYMMTATLGALSAIPDELYEAAQVDGASRLQQVQSITLPMLTAAFTPIVLSTFAFNFNNFGIIYLLNNGGPVEYGRLATAQSTDILISWGYKVAFLGAGDNAFGPASAIAIIVAVLTIGISVINFRVAGVFREARR